MVYISNFKKLEMLDDFWSYWSQWCWENNDY